MTFYHERSCLGVAFDQGLLLNYPERIPFRLTRDIEDGMGVFAIDGIFRRYFYFYKCCTEPRYF